MNTTKRMPRNPNLYSNADHSPLHGDHVRQTSGFLEGHVRALRHTATGLQVQVIQGGALTGNWIPASLLELVRRCEPAVLCEYLSR